MPIEVKCNSCQKRLRVPDKAAGKKIKCPGCESIIMVPAGDDEPTISITPQEKTPAKSSSPAKRSSSAGPAKEKQPAGKSKSAEMWRVQTEEGDEYGPIDRAELDDWVAEGRLNGDCQLLLEGQDQWQWASDVYPELDEHGGDDEQEAAEDNPFAFGDSGSSVGGKEAAVGLSVQADKGKRKSTPAASLNDDELSPRDRLGAGLLGIFAGAWGVHSFYLGKSTKGIIQIIVTLCTCGMGGIWGFIEGFMIIGGKMDRDSMGRKLRN